MTSAKQERELIPPADNSKRNEVRQKAKGLNATNIQALEFQAAMNGSKGSNNDKHTEF
jgi:hypothetical protein